MLKSLTPSSILCIHRLSNSCFIVMGWLASIRPVLIQCCRRSKLSSWYSFRWLFYDIANGKLQAVQNKQLRHSQVDKPPLWKSFHKWCLATFKPRYWLAVTRSSILTLMTSSSCLSFARSRSSSDTNALFKYVINHWYSTRNYGLPAK